MKTKTKQKSRAAYLRSVALSYQCATVPNPTAEDMPTSYLCFAESNVECGGEKNSLPWLLLAVRHSINQSENCFFRLSVGWYRLVFAQAELLSRSSAVPPNKKPTLLKGQTRLSFVVAEPSASVEARSVSEVVSFQSAVR